jgi:hypothetical protein
MPSVTSSWIGLAVAILIGGILKWFFGVLDITIKYYHSIIVRGTRSRATHSQLEGFPREKLMHLLKWRGYPDTAIVISRWEDGNDMLHEFYTANQGKPGYQEVIGTNRPRGARSRGYCHCPALISICLHMSIRKHLQAAQHPP